jgi:trk system potassium uptake protein TrkH
MDAEAPGPGIEKLTPRIAETARVLWGVYLGFTLLEAVLLLGLNQAGMAPNMGPYNAVSHALTTLPTGGFSPEARSIEAFSAAAQWVIIPFMVVAGTNFALFWSLLGGETGRIASDSEFRLYAGILAGLTALVAGTLFTGAGFLTVAPAGGTFDAAYLDGVRTALVGHVEPSVRHALFQVVSIVTTTGYASIDFNAWSPTAQYLLVFGMFIGGSAGSTGGGVKVVRWLVILKSLRRELFTTAHPDAVRPVRLGGRALDERAVRGIYAFTLLYFVLFFVSTALVFLDALGTPDLTLSILEAMTTVAATLGNIGPGFGVIGPMGNYLAFSPESKLFMCLLMWIGRLEILPVLVLLTPAYWRR